jgi:tRNA(adenine34) deaminase
MTREEQLSLSRVGVPTGPMALFSQRCCAHLDPMLLLGDDLLNLWMGRLLRLAATAGERGEVPVAAVVLDGQGHAVGWGSNQRQRKQKPLGHAELMALEQAARLRGDWRMNDCTLLVTLEPCPMCAGALVQARVGRVVFGASDSKRGALGGCLNLATDPSAHHRMAVVGGVLAEACSQQLELWFRRRRLQQQALKNGKPEAPAPEG